jgi:hypothetical protein
VNLVELEILHTKFFARGVANKTSIYCLPPSPDPFDSRREKKYLVTDPYDRQATKHDPNPRAKLDKLNAIKLTEDIAAFLESDVIASGPAR